MHPALLIAEILTRIFDHADRQTKARCARVCSAWEDLVRESLWFSIEGVSQFSAILGLEHGPRGSSPEHIDWDRVFTYADNVREFRSVRGGDWRMLRTLTSDPHHPLLFRRLVSLIWRKFPGVQRVGAHISYFLAPTLRELEIIDLVDAALACTVISSVPNITKLSLESYMHAEAIMDLLRALPKLEHIALTCTNWSDTIVQEALDLLSSLVNLKSLSLVTPDYAVDIQLDVNRFHALRSLSLTTTPLLYRSLWATRGHLTLNELYLDFWLGFAYGAELVEPFYDLFDDALEQTSHLQKITFHVTPENYFEILPILSGVRLAMGPLIHSPGLTHINISLGQPLLISNEELIPLFTTWRCLRFCNLNYLQSTTPGVYPTLSLLSVIAQHCRLLEGLHMCVKAPLEPQLVDAAHRFHRLNNMKLCFMGEIQHVPECAKFLRAVTPCTCKLKITYPINPRIHLVNIAEHGHAAKWMATRTVKQLLDVLDDLKTLDGCREKLNPRHRRPYQRKWRMINPPTPAS